LLVFLLLSPCFTSPIKHVIILMMENRSFDHLLGWLHTDHPDIDGLTGSESNPFNTSDPNGRVVKINKNGYDVGPDDPGHSWYATAYQIYGEKLAHGTDKPTPKMNGFVQENILERKSSFNPMSMFDSKTAPIINTLATEFAVFDHWYCSLPGPTDPNRGFAMSGTSNGMIDNFNGTLWSQKSYFEFLREHSVSWRAYYQDDPWAVMYFTDMHTPTNKKNVFELPQFFEDVKQNNLPQFTWLQPRMTSLHGPPTWQHPDASVKEGERLIKTIYEALRASTLWESLAFIITYDEHGGFYDHVTPPQTGIPAPDGNAADNGFRFDRLGIRVPTVLVSPWVPKGTIVHEPKMAGTHFDATAVIATGNKLFGVSDHMTMRDKWVGTFEYLFDNLESPRTDCLSELPELPPYTVEEWRKQHALPLNDHMQAQVDFYCKFNGHKEDCGKDIHNQWEASVFITKEAKEFMSR